MSSIASAVFAALVQTRLVASGASRTFGFAGGATTVSASLSMALIGVGHLVGMAVGIAMLVGLIISWFVLVPWLTAGAVTGAGAEELVGTVFSEQVRFIGAGTIGVAAIWTLLRILGPIVSGIRSAMAANRERREGRSAGLALTERDLPISIVGGTIIASMLPIALLLWTFAQSGSIPGFGTGTLVVSLVYILVAGIVIAAVCGYMAGLIGASNSPISGVGILSALGISLIIAALFAGADPASSQALVAFALFVTAIVFGVATISNDNLQDLKTGQLVGATPWRQQVALIIGVLFGAAVIPPILELLNAAFGFQGAPNAGPNALPAPQAALISAIAQGVLGGSLDWGLISIGAAIGVAVVIADEALRRSGKYSLPPLAVGMGIYLPMALTLLVPIGALIGWLYNRWALRQRDAGFAERMGVLMATGLIVGESLFGVAFAGIVGAAERAGAEDSASVLALVGDYPLAVPLGLLLFTATIAALYAKTRSDVAATPAAPDDAEFDPNIAGPR